VQEGTIQQDMLDELNAGDCADNQMDVVTFDQNPLAVEELRVGGAVAVLADFPVALNDANESEGELEVVGEQFDAAPYGIGLRKESTELKSTLEAALQEIKDDGTYESHPSRVDWSPVWSRHRPRKSPTSPRDGVPVLRAGEPLAPSTVQTTVFRFRSRACLLTKEGPAAWFMNRPQWEPPSVAGIRFDPASSGVPFDDVSSRGARPFGSRSPSSSASSSVSCLRSCG
jgi:hypothetical protein